MANLLKIVPTENSIQEPKYEPPRVVLGIDIDGQGFIIEVLNELACPYTVDEVREFPEQLEGFDDNPGIYTCTLDMHWPDSHSAFFQDDDPELYIKDLCPISYKLVKS